jgi:hypothetical protein
LIYSSKINTKIKNMRTFKIFFALVFAALILFSCSTKPGPGMLQKVGIDEFTGQWTIDIQGGSVGWLEVRQEEGFLDADLLWIGGSVVPVANIFLARDEMLIVTRTGEVVLKKDTAGIPLRSHNVTSWLEIRKQGDKIAGFLLDPKTDGTGVDSTSFTGTKLPPVPPIPDLTALKFGKPIVLFNGKDLTGWKLINDKQKNGFTVANGVITNDPAQVEGQPHISYGNLRTEQEFSDFNLKIEVNVPANSNSGIYLRGMYEIQVIDSYGKELDPHNMGAVYSRIKPTVSAEKQAGTWQTMDIMLCDRHITVILNGTRIIDNQPVYGPTGGAIISDVFAPGPIYLQGDHGKVQYRNIVLTPIEK